MQNFKLLESRKTQDLVYIQTELFLALSVSENHDVTVVAEYQQMEVFLPLEELPSNGRTLPIDGRRNISCVNFQKIKHPEFFA